MLSAEPGFLGGGGGRSEVLIGSPPSEGRPIREDGFGGWGNEAMLTDFLSVLSPPADAILLTAVLRVGTAGVDALCWVFGVRTGMAALDGTRNFEGVCGADGMRADRPALLARVEGRLFRVFETGRGGRAVVGGS